MSCHDSLSIDDPYSECEDLEELFGNCSDDECVATPVDERSASCSASAGPCIEDDVAMDSLGLDEEPDDPLVQAMQGCENPLRSRGSRAGRAAMPAGRIDEILGETEPHSPSTTPATEALVPHIYPDSATLGKPGAEALDLKLLKRPAEWFRTSSINETVAAAGATDIEYDPEIHADEMKIAEHFLSNASTHSSKSSRAQSLAVDANKNQDITIVWSQQK